MAKKNPSLYSVSKTFVWFAIVSIILTGSLAAVVMLDYERDWKNWQKKFIALKTQKTKEDLKQADQNIDKQKLEDLKKQYSEADTAVKAHHAEYQKLQSQIESLNTKAVKVRSQYQNLKQFQDSYKYFFEEYSDHKDKRAADYRKKLDEIDPKVAQAKLDLDAAEKEKETAEARSQEFLSKEKALQKDIDKILDEKNRLEKKLAKLKPSVVTDILNAPMLDFIAPTLKIQQVVLEDIQDDYHFAKVPKVDRCTTCHLGIDQKGYENAPQPFRTHPKLDLYLASSSPHPVEKFGCTVCHDGSGHSVDFTDSAHTPRDQKQAEEWQKKYRWHPLEKWDHKMLPLNHVEASCTKCHMAVVEIPQAEKLNRGRKLAETYGCFNCHKISGFENRWKVGPSLENVGSKLNEDWIVRWVSDPQSFRPSTKMPKIFNLSNTSSPEDKDRNDAAIKGIAAYLMKNSGTADLLTLPKEGNAERGEKVIKEIGCTGCHTVAGISANNFGPELSGLGSKVKKEWLYTWIKDPKHFSKDTRMPNLRVSDEDAADIVSFLMSQKNTDFEAKPLPEAKPAVVDEMLLSSMQGTMRRSEAEAELAKMGPQERLELLGKKSIAYQGCFTCHAIKGFEDAKPIGAELTNEGQKDIHQFDFGFAEIEHTRQGFIAQKLKEPRIFDNGKVKAYYEKLRMPQFHFTDQEIDDLTTFVLSLSESHMPLEMQKRLDSKDVRIEKGRLLVSKLNCNGCHELDGKKGALRELADDKGSAPPILDGEGAKVRQEWLYHFLKNPTTIRPWLKYHMPTFNLSDEDVTALVEYFSELAKQEATFRDQELPETSTEKLAVGKVLFDKFQCTKCHQVNKESAAMGTSFLAPDLTMAKQRLKPHWVKEWLSDPQKLQEGTMMPTFFADGQTPVTDVLGGDANQQIEAIRDYLYTYGTTASPSAPTPASESKPKEDKDTKNTIAK